MLFNLDKEAKQSLLAQFKQDALNYRRKIKEEECQRIQDEKQYLENTKLRQQETVNILNDEKKKKKNELMNEYQLMLTKKNDILYELHNKMKKKDVVINNWGMDQNYLSLNYLTPVNNKKENIRIIKPTKSLEFYQLNAVEKEKEILRQRDHMNKYLTDEQNENEVSFYFRKQNENRLIFYKDLLFSQFQKANDFNKKLYETENALLIEQKKRKRISDNPYIRKYKYYFGDSSLPNNPITNPQNNFLYNKYLNYRNYSSFLPIEDGKRSDTLNICNNSMTNSLENKSNVDINNYYENIGNNASFYGHYFDSYKDKNISLINNNSNNPEYSNNIYNDLINKRNYKQKSNIREIKLDNSQERNTIVNNNHSKFTKSYSLPNFLM